MELTSRDIHYYSHPHRRSKSPIRPLGIVFPIQPLGSSLFPIFLSSRAPLLKQRTTCAKGCDPIDINFLQCCQPNTQTWRPQHNYIPIRYYVSNIDLKDLIDAADSNNTKIKTLLWNQQIGRLRQVRWYNQPYKLFQYALLMNLF